MRGDETIVIAEIISVLFPIEWARRTMYHKNDIYSRIPQFIFRLKDDAPKSNYYDIENCIGSFNGNLKWALYKCYKSRKGNYSIVPADAYFIEKDYLSKGNVASERDILSDDTYRKICEQAIDDIPNLAKHLMIFFSLHD